MTTVLCLFGTRPEVIKLAPVIRELEARPQCFRAVNVSSCQHADLLHPFVRHFAIRVDHELGVMQSDQAPGEVCARVLTGLEPVLAAERPDLLLVQGDTTTALAGALAGFYAGIPVGHVEAGLRSGNAASPFPEEMNRRLITRLARYHFAATEHNARQLRAEGVPDADVALTGNPVVDALESVCGKLEASPELREVLDALRGTRLVALTTHRRESFGAVLSGNLRVLRSFVRRHEDVSLVFPVHPNPQVERPAREILGSTPRVRLLAPLDYFDFIGLLSVAWLVVSDSGGVQEEAPTLGVPLLVLRENTERPEAIEAGVARLVGGAPQKLEALLEEVYSNADWTARVRRTPNPFGRGDAAARIVSAIEEWLAVPRGG